MEKNHRKVILLPTFEKELKDKIIKTMEQKEYAKALNYIEELVSYGGSDENIFDAKLLCLYELGDYEEAEVLCEEYMALKNENYYKYVHNYISILFKTMKYDLLLERIEKELNTDSLPADVREEYLELYQLVGQTKEDSALVKRSELLNDFYEALSDDDSVTQWQTLEGLRELKVDPPEEIIHYLHDEKIDPVVKTALFKWLIDREISKPIKVYKFEQTIEAFPTQFASIEEHHFMKEVLLSLKDIEQNNPSLYYMLEQLLYRYIYVQFPLIPRSDEIECVAEALLVVGEQYMHLDVSKEPVKLTIRYMKEIIAFEKMYLEVIEQY